MKIDFSTIFGQCQDISSFEGRRLTDGDGQSLYPVVHITDQDKDLIREYLERAITLIEGELRYAIDHVTYSADSYDLAITTDRPQPRQKQVEETICSNIISLWLENKNEERCKAYQMIYANMLLSLQKIIKKKRPVLT